MLPPIQMINNIVFHVSDGSFYAKGMIDVDTTMIMELTNNLFLFGSIER
jgi:hypothetical protein